MVRSFRTILAGLVLAVLTVIGGQAQAQVTGCPIGSTSVLGCYRVDGTTITVNSGVISAIGAGAASIQVGVTTVLSGTNPFLLYNNAGVLGNETFAAACTAATNSVFGCVKVDGTTITASAGVISAVGGGGSNAFSALTGSTNTTAAMVVGTGASINFTGSGTINASTLGGATFASPGAIGSGTPSTGAFAGLTATSSFAAIGLVTYADIVNGTGNHLLRSNTGAAPSEMSEGAGVFTALGVNVGTAGAFVVNGGALGTPSSGSAANLTGLPLTGLATQATNTVVANVTAGSASPTALAVSSCSAAGNALNWTTNTGFGCVTGLSSAVGANPTATAGAAAVNGSSANFMRADGAPAVAKATNAVFGIVEVDGTTITSAAGVISAIGGSATSITVGTTTIGSGTTNGLLYDNAGVLGNLATGNNGTLITSAGGVPSISSTLPSAVQGNITSVGTIGSGTWQGTVVGATFGGTGINNGSNTLTLGNALTFASLTVTNDVLFVSSSGNVGQETFAAACTSATAAAFGCVKVDNATITASSGIISTEGGNIYILNAGSTGTTVNKLAKLTGAPSTAVITATTDSPNATAVGLVTAGAGTSGTATIQYSGIATCVFDGATVAGHAVGLSTSVAGDCTDLGATPGTGQIIGFVLGTIGAAGNAPVNLNIPTTSAIPNPGANQVLASNGSSVAGWQTEGNTITVSGGLIDAKGANYYIPNAGSTGTTVNKLAKATGAPSTAVITATTDSPSATALGIVTAGAGTSGTATIQYSGVATCVFDGATVAGHPVQLSTTTAGDCHDPGSVTPSAGQIVGVVLGTIGSAGNAPVALNVPPTGGPTPSYLGVNQTYTAGQAVTPDTATSCGTQSAGGTMTPDFSKSNSCQATFGAGNLTVAAPINVIAGQNYLIELKQDGTGSRTVTWNAAFDWGTAGAPTLSTGASKIDIISCYARLASGANSLHCTANLGF